MNFIGAMKINVVDLTLVIELHWRYEDQCDRSDVVH
ncbi:hypothetical protein J2Z37_002242 [Ammoniphilus resinae]|uniref:Uncharacterized protein n=1 Tax=Ammoniphilus resinae TaxID=861532 RepID=A0ABS4GPR4_9BACL|nr:hypothetical protein [Ammoniphilus resinae]